MITCTSWAKLAGTQIPLCTMHSSAWALWLAPFCTAGVRISKTVTESAIDLQSFILTDFSKRIRNLTSNREWLETNYSGKNASCRWFHQAKACLSFMSGSGLCRGFCERLKCWAIPRLRHNLEIFLDVLQFHNENMYRATEILHLTHIKRMCSLERGPFM